MKINGNDVDIKEATWFTEMGSSQPIGIVVVKDSITKKHKAYIGTGNGFDEYIDARNILIRGAKLHISQLKAIINILEQER